MVFVMLQIPTKQNIKIMSHLLEIKNLDVKFDTDEGRITAIDNVSLSLTSKFISCKTFIKLLSVL